MILQTWRQTGMLFRAAVPTRDRPGSNAQVLLVVSTDCGRAVPGRGVRKEKLPPNGGSLVPPLRLNGALLLRQTASGP